MSMDFHLRMIAEASERLKQQIGTMVKELQDGANELPRIEYQIYMDHPSRWHAVDIAEWNRWNGDKRTALIIPHGRTRNDM